MKAGKAATRPRTERARTLPAARPLLRGVDHGEPIRVGPGDIGASGERWVDPFLRANEQYFRRLDLRPIVATEGGLHVRLTPGSHLGAIPLLSPTTQRPVAGLVIAPKHRWSGLGAIFEATGFSTEPRLGGAPLVPGSARDVPPWLLAGPVLNRLEALLGRTRRAFTVREELRTSPRGRVDWGEYARHSIPSGRWSEFPCTFSEPASDPDLLARLRWTVQRLSDSLGPFATEGPARALLTRTRTLSESLGPGPLRRPGVELAAHGGGVLAEALEAMGWVAEQRGLGGSQSLDGLAWDLAVDVVWEAWVAAFVAQLAPQVGLLPAPRGSIRRPLRWRGSVESMGSLAPDSALQGLDRCVWIDAKYKLHLLLLAKHGWRGVSDAVREAHRADLHQALAYASLAETTQVDSVLVYPELPDEERAPLAVATVQAGKRRVRLVLAGLPFGFRSQEQRERVVARWRELLHTSSG